MLRLALPVHPFAHRLALLRLLTVSLLLGVTGFVHAQAQPPLPTTRLTAGIHVITAEVAQDNPSRMRGLMFREKLPPNGGMLFVFEAKGVQCMWMRNTLIPLSVAFIEDDGTIVNIEDMKPRDETTQHCSKRPVAFALEMSQGWFAQRGIKAGAKIGGIK